MNDRLRFSRFAVAALLGAGLVRTGVAQMPSPVSATARVAPAALHPGAKGTLTVSVSVGGGWHVNANKPTDDSLIPTEFVAKAAPGVTFGKPVYPKAQRVDSPASPGKPLQVYENTFLVTVPFTVAPSAKPGKLILTGQLQAQACNDSACLPPKTIAVSAPLTISAR